MTWSREKFKTAFSTKSQNQKRLERRVANINKVLDRIDETIKGWKAEDPFAVRLKKLRDDVEKRIKEGVKNHSDAYRALAETKIKARQLLIARRSGGRLTNGGRNLRPQAIQCITFVYRHRALQLGVSHPHH